ncbi:HDOD domain-containing protein [Alteromonas sp. 14N.309.X.WAT.G.H12]|uniref:HDOD domain-containing protein n=1 Tax=Alteromonas sp. 14N.309.X.WAT.G.H12 TaxID=3120824 RepID=UPI002FD4620E
MRDEHARSYVHRRVTEKFLNWLLTSKLAQTEDLYDGLLSDYDYESEIAFDKFTRKPTQRLLLDVEKDSEIRRAEIRQREQELRGIGQQLLSEKMRAHITQQTSNFSYVKNNLLAISPEYLDAIQELSNSFGSIRRLSSILSTTDELSDNLLRLVNSPEFCMTTKRPPKKIMDLTAACGLIGMDGLRFLVPGIFLKNRLKSECEHFPLLSQKIWSYYVTSSNAARHRLVPHNCNTRDELTAMVTGAIVCMGMVALHKQFNLSFEFSKRALLEELRAKRKNILYHAVLDVTPSPMVLRELLESSSMRIVNNVATQCDWGHKGKVRQAVVEHANDKKSQERSIHGLAVGQGSTYAMWFLLSNANLLKSSPKLEKLAMSHVRLPMSCVEDLKAKSVNKLVMGDYIG